MPSFQSVAVIGAGAWGTALACVAARAGRDVMLYARSAESAAQMQTTRKNPRLPGVSLDTGIDMTTDIAPRRARTSSCSQRPRKICARPRRRWRRI